MLISVIVPVYKVEDYLDRCVESILAQSISDFELILVDDGSPDECPAICDAWAEKDSRVRVIHKENGGVSAARNTGLDAARGEYIAFCDSDDSWDASFLSVLVNTAEQGQRDLVSCTFRKVYSEGEKWEWTVSPGLHTFSGREDAMRYLHRILLQGKEGWEICTRLFRLRIIRENNIRFCTTCRNFAEDMAFVAQYVMYARSVQVLDDCLYNYTVREGSMMKTSRDIIRLDEMNAVSRFLGESYSKALLGRKWKKYRAITHYMVMYNQLQKMVQQERLMELPACIAQIQDRSWFRKCTWGIFGAYGLLKDYVGTQDARRVFMLSGYCLHKSWWAYRVTRGLFNKLFGYRKG